MMNTYWLYLEPYTFVFHNKKKAVFYNTTNGKYLAYHYSDHEYLEDIVLKLDNPSNGYGTLISEMEIKRMNPIIENLRDSFTGDCIPVDTEDNLPFIFKPLCRVMEDKISKMEHVGNEIGENYAMEVLTNLNEVTLFLAPDKQECGQDSDYPYYHQFIHSLDYPCNTPLTLKEYSQLIAQLCNIGIGTLNLVLNESACDVFHEILPLLCECECKVNLYINDRDLKMLHSMATPQHFQYIVNVHHLNQELLNDWMKNYKMFDIHWNFIVASETDLQKASQWDDNVSILPYYNGSNNDFFENFVYSDLDTILNTQIDKQTIFRRQILNEEFFGKLFILSNGDVFSNMNTQPIGNIKNVSLAQIVYEELHSTTSWFKLREYGKCKDCVNKYLCPSISNYEWVIGKPDLCHIE